MAVNTTYRMAPWADALFAMDKQWWDTYRRDVMVNFRGMRVSNNPNHDTHRVRIPAYGNSGAGAIATAVHWGAKRVILLGYDCQHTGGMAHWHGDHPKGLGNARMVDKWAEKFAELAETIPPSVDVVNCSRVTALNCWPRGDLVQMLYSGQARGENEPDRYRTG